MDEPDATGSIEISAPPELVYRIVSDVPNLPDWAAECYRCSWLGDATGPAVGARFVGYNRHRIFRWPTLAKVTAAKPGRSFGFDVLMVARWEYRIEPTPGGCTVTESTWDRRGPFMKWIVAPLSTGVIDRKTRNAKNIVTTLQALKARAEQRSTAPKG